MLFILRSYIQRSKSLRTISKTHASVHRQKITSHSYLIHLKMRASKKEVQKTLGQLEISETIVGEGATVPWCLQ